MFLNPGVSKPGCFPLFSGKVQIVSRTLSGLFLVGALNRPRKRKRTNRENARAIPEQIGKIPEKSGKSQKGQKKGQKSQKGRKGAGVKGAGVANCRIFRSAVPSVVVWSILLVSLSGVK